MVAAALIFFAELKLASPRPIWLGAETGSDSHIVFDSLMHSDIVPLSPFSGINVLYQLVPLGELHLFCVFAAVSGLVILGIRRLIKARYTGAG